MPLPRTPSPQPQCTPFLLSQFLGWLQAIYFQPTIHSWHQTWERIKQLSFLVYPTQLVFFYISFLYIFIFLYSRIELHCIYAPHFHFLFTSWRIFQVFPFPSLVNIVSVNMAVQGWNTKEVLICIPWLLKDVKLFYRYPLPILLLSWDFSIYTCSQFLN